uniref:Fatty acid-binding protein, muscle n=5 Tax=Timema TaxID=61471 RepID=A0A7R9J4E7_TIMCA|nr:unnamed protein product [Timema californicum]
MSSFSRNVLKIVVAQICQTIGWQGIHTTPLEIMIDILHKYLQEIAQLTHRFSEHGGHTIPTLEDLALAFEDMGVSLKDLDEYVKNVEPVPCVFDVPKYPVPRESHLNFLKPGSREVVTRLVHVHEHLPPMFPELEEEEQSSKHSPLSLDVASPLTSPKANVFKRPGDPIESPAAKRARLMLEEEGRPLREISSVMMTTSGFISPAREGKLPEARTPPQPSNSRSNSPQPSSYPTVPPEVTGEKKPKKIPAKKTVEGIQKIDKENKKKVKRIKEMKESKPTDGRPKVKKLASMKELSKLKALKSGALRMMSHTMSAELGVGSKVSKVNAPQAQSKPPPSDTSDVGSHQEDVKPPPITPPLFQPVSTSSVIKEVGKLRSEPDRQKLNIFKKITKIKEDKTEKLEHSVSRESSSVPINKVESNVKTSGVPPCANEPVVDKVNDIPEDKPLLIKANNSPKTNITVSPIVQTAEGVPSRAIDRVSSLVPHQNLSSNDDYMFDNDLYPVNLPKTPDMPSIPERIETKPEPDKKPRKSRTKTRKEPKDKTQSTVTSKATNFKPEMVGLGGPRLPPMPGFANVLVPPVFPFFPNFHPVPGLIPPSLGHPLFPNQPILFGKNLPFPAMTHPLFSPPQKHLADVKEPPKLNLIPSLPSSSLPSSSLPSSSLPLKLEPVETSVEPIPLVKEKTGEKKIKEHKKVKKEKEKDKDKVKRKKNKKDKVKTEKKLKTNKKVKSPSGKKNKTEKKKDKPVQQEKVPSGTTDVIVPKITLKLFTPDPRPLTPDEAPTRKIFIKPVIKKETETDQPQHFPSTEDVAPKRVESPELARISALLTRPPKPKSTSKTPLPKPELCLDTVVPSPSISSAGPSLKKSETKQIHKKITSIVDPPKEPLAFYYASSVPGCLTGGLISDLAIRAKPRDSCGFSCKCCTASNSSQGWTIKTPGHIIGGDSLHLTTALGMSGEGGLSDFGCHTTPQTSVTQIASMDADGNKVWICPACGGKDDGSPMIGCDHCDAWYHWFYSRHAVLSRLFGTSSIMEAFLGKKYKLVSSENFDEYMKALGVGLVTRKMGNALSPVIELTEAGGVYTFKTSTTFRSTEITAKLGVEFDEETADGRKVKSLLTLENNKLVHVQKGEKDTTLIREFSPEQVKATMTVDDIVCTRIYKAVE